MRQELVLQTSVLIGQGRLFFKNVLTENSDSKGFRPKILDPLILAHRIAAHWPDDDDARSILTKRCVSGFIQFSGDEVGRKQAASVLAASAGDEMNLTFWMCQASQNGAKSLFE